MEPRMPDLNTACGRAAHSAATLLRLVAIVILAAALGSLANACRASRDGGGLENVHWRLVDIHGTPAIADSSAREVYIVFNAADSNARGSAGCNSFGGTYTRNGDRLTISRIISTKMACLATGAMEQESAFFGALQATASWHVRGDTLELYDAAGAAVARFRAEG